MLRLMGVRGVPAVLLALALLVACGSEELSDERKPASAGGSVVAPNVGFGGVVEVTVSIDERGLPGRSGEILKVDRREAGRTGDRPPAPLHSLVPRAARRERGDRLYAQAEVGGARLLTALAR